MSIRLFPVRVNGVEGRDTKKAFADKQFIKPGTPRVPQDCQY